MQNIVICSLVVSTSIIVQTIKVHSEKIVLKRFVAAAILFLPVYLCKVSVDPLSYLTISVVNLRPTVIYATMFSFIAIILIRKFGSRMEKSKNYPHVTIEERGMTLFALKGLSWIVYLTAYEVLFRGFLFFSCFLFTSIEKAFVISVVLYAVAHLHKSEREFLLSVPFGTLLCYITLVTENIWAATIIHITVALCNDVFAFRVNPELTTTKKLSL